MRSKLMLLLIVLISMVWIGSAYSASITAIPTKVPKGAYVNGPGGASDDNYFFQTLAITIGAAHVVTDAITITVPAGVYVANIDGDGSYADEISADVSDASAGAAAVTVTSANASQVVLAVAGADLAALDVVYVMIPVTSDTSPASSTGEYTVAFTGGTEDITTGNGATVTFVDPGPTNIGAVTFNATITANNDTTETDGEIWPTSGGAYSALPDYLQDITANTVINPNLPANILAVFENVANVNTNDVIYRIFASKDSTLAHVDDNDTGVIQLYNYTTYPATQNYANEADTAAGGFTVSNLPEGDWYIYVVSWITGDFPLGRSGRLTVRHWPQVDVLAWDRDVDGLESAVDDNANITLDSGAYLGIDGTMASTLNPAASDVEIFIAVDDFDDAATVSLWRSTSSALTTSDIITSGTSPNLVVTGLGSTAVALVDTLKENLENEDGYLTWTFQNPTSGNIITAGAYYIYAVANDGKHQYIKALQGFNSANSPTYSGSTKYTLNISHSPNLTINSLDEYNYGSLDTGLNADVTINQSQTDVVMLSWGKQGITGDTDPDNNCTIEFYIDYDSTNDDLPDYGSDEALALRAAALAAGTDAAGPHRIVADLVEDPEGKVDSYYAWNLKQDYLTTGWAPYDESVGTNGYHLYAIISEGATLTERIVCLGVVSGIQSTTFTTAVSVPRPTTIEFALAQPYVKLFDPPQKGMTVSGDETYRLNFEAFDWANNANIGVFAVKVGAGEFVTNGEFNTGSTGWTLGANWNYNSGMITRTPAAATNLSQAFTTAAVNYILTFEVKNATAGTVTPTLGGTAGTARSTNGVYTETILATAVGTGIVFAPSITFDGSIDNVSVKIATATDGAMTTTITTISALPAGNAYALTSTSGALAAGVWLPENTSTYYDMTLRLPSEPTSRYTTSLNGAGAMTNGNYWVYIGAGSLGAAPVGTTNLYRAPGILTVTGLTETAAQRNLIMTPMSFVSTIGDTTRILINAADEGGNVDIIDAYIAVEKEYFELMSASSPFTDATGFGSLIANEAIDDSTNGRWILHVTVFNSGNAINPANTDMGSTVASFLVKGKGTNAADGKSSSIYFVNEPAKGWETTFRNDGVALSFNSSNSTVNVRPRAIIEGIVEFQGRTYANNIVTFDLRKRGSYIATTDTVFVNRNDGAIADSTYKLDSTVTAPTGIQYKLDTEGKFTLTNVPTGDWELVVSYPRFLSKMQTLYIAPGLDTLFVNFDKLLGGDCIGYTDSLGDAYPNNAITQTDIDRITYAFLSTPDSTKWDTAIDPSTGGKYNYKWADINEDNEVEVKDLSIATSNFLYGGEANIGAQPVYMKPAGGEGASNANAIVEMMNVPTELTAGNTYTIQVVVSNAADVIGYYVSLGYDSSEISFNNIVNGDFIDSQSQVIPVVANETVGLANAVYGANTFSGSGILAEVTFTALHDGMFTADMISLEQAEFVNSSFIGEDVITVEPTVVDGGTSPEAFVLGQNFPNPFNPTTTISFAIPESSPVAVKIYDILGRHVRTLVDGKFNAGNHTVVWNAKDDNGNNVSAGVYFYAIKAGNYHATKRMLFLK